MFDDSYFRFPDSPAGLYDPLRYMIGIGGKRIRPRLCLLSYGLFREKPCPGLEDVAAALEIFHSFTLIHDDIMDRSPLRRGKSTVWKRWGEDTAILSGDVMLIEAYKRIVKAPEQCRMQVVDLFSDTAGKVCEGQQLDMEFENADFISMREYHDMIGLKTAVLLACAAKTGGLIAGASQEDCDALWRYGYDLGIAFQIADDYLDAYGDQQVFGKPIGGDIINGKKSWLTIRALEKNSGAAAFTEAFRAKDVAEVKRQYDSLGVPADALAEIVRYSGSARSALDSINADCSPLEDFAEKLVGRVR